MNVNEILVREEFRRDIYKWLSLCFFLPDEDLIFELSSSKTDMVAEELSLAPSLFRNLNLESLRVDYSRLFIGPYQLLAPPYGSIYLENTGTVMGTSTMNARKMYEDAGLNLTLKDAPDHVAIELEFMYYLIHQEIEAFKNSDESLASLGRHRQVSFLNEHLSAWISPFSNKIIEYAQTEFYRNIAISCETFVLEHWRSYQ